MIFHNRLLRGAFLVLWAIAAISLASAIAPLPAGAQTAPIVIRLTTVTTPTMSSSQSLVHFKERVEAESKGALQVQIYFTSSLYSDSDAPAAVSSGQVEMAYINLHRFAGRVPVTNAFQLPFLFNTDALERAGRAAGSEVRDLIDSQLMSGANVRPLWWIPIGQTVLVAKDASYGDPKAVQSKVVRSFGKLTENILKACGARPKDVDSADQPRAYASGEIDVGMTTAVIISGRQLWRSMNTITRFNVGSMQVVVVMNEPFFQSLSPGHQAIVAAAAQAANTEADESAAQADVNAYKDLAEKGVKTVDLNTEELQLWRICSSDVLQEFVDKNGEGAQQLMTAYAQMRARMQN
jgi:C4-dicarboxylate-binding protein DctP